MPQPCKRAEKAMKQEDDIDTNRSWSPWNNLQEPGKEAWWTEN